jgi:predicted membrane protein
VRLRATAVAGRIIVRVPPGAAVAVHGRVGGGEVDLFGRSYDGLNVDVRRTFAPATPRSPSVVLDLEASFGKVEVESLEVGP